MERYRDTEIQRQVPPSIVVYSGEISASPEQQSDNRNMVGAGSQVQRGIAKFVLTQYRKNVIQSWSNVYKQKFSLLKFF